MSQAKVVNMPIPLVCTVHLVSAWSDSPGDDKGIANLLSCREWGTICNLFLYLISWDQWVAAVPSPAGVHSISLNTSKSVICFPFLCPIPFFFKTLNFFLSLFFQFLVYSLLCFLLKIFHLSSLLLLTCCDWYFPPIEPSACQETNCGSCMHR